MFDKAKRLASNLQNINPNLLIEKIVQESSVQAQIIDLNQAQLYEQGIESDGSPTGNYRYNTIVGVPGWFRGKIEKGQRFDHITLKDEEDFYNSMKVVPDDQSFSIYGDTEKSDSDLQDRWPKALGLTKESVSEIIPEIKDRLNDSIKVQMYK